MRKTSALLAATAIAAITLPAAASGASAADTADTANTASSAPIPAFDYRDCPQLPGGVDPAKWRCEVMVADGTATVGGSTAPFRFTRVTHAEGPMPDGSPGQVFGAFRAAKLEVPGRQSGTGHGPRLWMQPRLTSVPDFYSQAGAMTMTFELSGPRLGDRCSIGTADVPVQVAAGRVPGTAKWVSQDPPVITFQVLDDTLAVPEVSGCGRTSEELDRRFGLPSPSGANRLAGTVFYSFKTYDRL